MKTETTKTPKVPKSLEYLRNGARVISSTQVAKNWARSLSVRR